MAIQKTVKNKLENYWYYYKFHTVAAVFIITVLIFSLAECASRINPDLSVVCAYTGYMDLAALEEKMSGTVGDLNGDGKAKVLCDNIYLSGEQGSQQDMAMREKLFVSFVTGEYRLYIMGKEFFETESFAECFETLDGILPSNSLDGGIKFGGGTIAVSAKNCPYLQDTGIDCEKLYVGILHTTEATKNVKNIDVLYDASKRLISEMVK